MSWFKECTDEEYDEYMESEEAIRIRDEGADAYNLYHINKPYIDCLYEKGTKEHEVWHIGWSSQNYN